jgi:ribosomal protein S13
LTEALDLEQEIFQPEPATVASFAQVEAKAEAKAEAAVTMTRHVEEPLPAPAEVEPVAPEELSFGAGDAIAKADLEEMELLDDLSLQEPAAPAPTRADVPEEEQFLTATFQNVQPAARSESEFGLELPTDELLEVPVPEDSANADLLSEAMPAAAPDVSLDEPVIEAEPPPEPAGLTEETWQAEVDSTQTTDMSMFETKESAAPVDADMANETMETAAQEQAAPMTAATSASSGGVSESFEDAFAALKEEIESNPEGERIDDILKMEQLQEQVAKIEFTIPLHEHALARGMPLTALLDAAPVQATARAVPATAARTEAAAKPTRTVLAGGPAPAAMAAVRQETRASSTVTTTVTTKTAAVVQRTEAPGVFAGTRHDLGLAATGSLLDDSARARLGQILDEIISTSVRKAVREEMPRLMERIARETDPSAPA